MFGKKIKLEDKLYNALKLIAEKEGYSSINEFAVKILEEEIEKHIKTEDADKREQLKGLGYF